MIGHTTVPLVVDWHKNLNFEPKYLIRVEKKLRAPLIAYQPFTLSYLLQNHLEVTIEGNLGVLSLVLR